MAERTTERGFTIIEVVVVIIIVGVLATVAIKSGGALYDASRVEETRQEMDAIARAVVGNPELENNGTRCDFGYVGDVGSLPTSLDNLVTNPGGYTTWNGPYVSNRFAGITDDYKTDAWGATYGYSGGVTLTSSGSGTNMVRRLAAASGDLLLNSFSGTILDIDGTPPGATYADSLTIRLTYPNGAGGTSTTSAPVDAGGWFEFGSIPMGNHELLLVYEPAADTLTRYASILPGSDTHSEFRLGSNVWFALSDITNGLVGHWKLDESSGTTASDNAGGNDGTLISMNPGSDWVTGKVDGALDFDGSNDYVDCGNGVSLSLTGTSITVIAWVRWDSNDSWSAIAMKTSSGSWTNGYGLYAHSNGTVNFYVTRWNQNRASASFAADGAWHHVAGTYDGSSVRIWVDGVEGTPDAYTGNITDAADSFEIGRGASNSYNFNGSIDDVRVYNRALTPTEVQTLYSLGS